MSNIDLLSTTIPVIIPPQPVAPENVTDWMIHTHDGSTFHHSMKYKIWGINANSPASKNFKNCIKRGDRIWFIAKEKKWKKSRIIAVATFTHQNVREQGELIDLAIPHSELYGENYDATALSNIDFHYTNLYYLHPMCAKLEIKIDGILVIRKYKNEDKYEFDFPMEYKYISKYMIPI
jgi:hypothetical protein